MFGRVAPVIKTVVPQTIKYRIVCRIVRRFIMVIWPTFYRCLAVLAFNLMVIPGTGPIGNPGAAGFGGAIFMLFAGMAAWRF